MSTNEEPHFDLVMPFVTVASKGGTHDDAAFVAGYALGLLDADLRHAHQTDADVESRTLNTVDAPQVDLLAMRYGFTVTSKATDDNYSLFVFESRADAAWLSDGEGIDYSDYDDVEGDPE